MEIRDLIIKAENTGSDGKMYKGNTYTRESKSSSAVGNGQFTKFWYDKIKEFAINNGYKYDDISDFKNNSTLQDEWMGFYLENYATPAIERLKRRHSVPENITDDHLYLLYHKVGYPKLRELVKEGGFDEVEADISPNEYLRRAGVSTIEDKKPVAQTPQPKVQTPDTVKAEVDNTYVANMIPLDLDETEEYQDGGAMGNTTIINEDGVEVPAVRFEKEEPTQKKEVNNKPLSSGTKSTYEIKKPTQPVVYNPRPKTTPITLDKVGIENKPTTNLNQLDVPSLQYTPSGSFYPDYGYPNWLQHSEEENLYKNKSTGELYENIGTSNKLKLKKLEDGGKTQNNLIPLDLDEIEEYQDAGLLDTPNQTEEPSSTRVELALQPTEQEMQQQWEKENLPNINPNDRTNIATGRADQAGFFDDPVTMGILAPIAPATLFSKPATTTAGKAGQFVVDAANPIAGFKNINPKTVRVNKLNNRLMQSDDLFTPEMQEVTNEIAKIQGKQRAFANTKDKIKNTITDVIKKPKRNLVMPLLKAHQEGKLNMKNIYYSVQNNIKGDSWAHNFFNMTPQDVNKEISKIISGIPKGGRFSEKSLSTDSFKLLLPKASAKKKDFKVISTNSYNPLNDFGKKGRKLKQLLGESRGKEEIIKDVNRYIDRFIRNTGTEIPKAKLINNEVYIPNLIFQRKEGSPLKALERFRNLGVLGVGSGITYLTTARLIDSIVKGTQSDLEILIDYLTGEYIPRKQDGGNIEEKQQRANKLYNPIREKLINVASEGTNDEYFNDDGTLTTFGKNYSTIHKYVGDFAPMPVDENRNPPPVDKTIKEIQERISKLSPEQVKTVLSTDFTSNNPVKYIGLLKNVDVSVGDILRYKKHFNKLKEQGYTFQKGGKTQNNLIPLDLE